MSTRQRIRQEYKAYLAVCCCLLLSILLISCDTGQPGNAAGSSGASAQPVTYSTKAEDVLIRTFHGGGLYGTFSLGPQLSIYGDGTYIVGLDQQGKLTADELQKLLANLVDTNGLLNLKRLQFSDVSDQNATFLELSLNGKQQELMYGTFGSQQESAQDMDEYQRLGKALTALNEAIKGPLHAYNSDTNAVLVRRTFNPDPTQVIQPFYAANFSLTNAALYECGTPVEDNTSMNAESGCLKYTIPQNVILLDANQRQSIKTHLGDQQLGTFLEQGRYYTVQLRPLLPDEAAKKSIAMFGSAQASYKGIPLHEGLVPTPAPTPRA